MRSYHVVSSVSFAKGDKTGSTEAPFLCTSRTQTALMAAAWILPGHFTQLGTERQTVTLLKCLSVLLVSYALHYESAVIQQGSLERQVIQSVCDEETGSQFAAGGLDSISTTSCGHFTSQWAEWDFFCNAHRAELVVTDDVMHTNICTQS